MTWSYRLVEFEEEPKQDTYWRICEVYYNDKGEPGAYCDGAKIHLQDTDGDPKKGAEEILERMRKDIQRPILKRSEITADMGWDESEEGDEK